MAQKRRKRKEPKGFSERRGIAGLPRGFNRPKASTPARANTGKDIMSDAERDQRLRGANKTSSKKSVKNPKR